jgi:hypothetical protein
MDSKLDHKYYCDKYNLHHLNKLEAQKHYISTGKHEGLFQNANSELIYCNKMNFDCIYYSHKYNLPKNTDPKKHWKMIGCKKGYYTNICDETGTHDINSCKCTIKDNTAYKRDIDSCYEYSIPNSSNSSSECPSAPLFNNEIQSKLDIDKKQTVYKHNTSKSSDSEQDEHSFIENNDVMPCDDSDDKSTECSDCLKDKQNGYYNTNVNVYKNTSNINTRISKPKDVYINTSKPNKNNKTVTINTKKSILKNVSKGDKVVIQSNTSIKNKNNKDIVNLVNDAFINNNDIDDFEMKYFDNTPTKKTNYTSSINQPSNCHTNEDNGIGFFDLLTRIGSSLTRPLFNHIENTINQNNTHNGIDINHNNNTLNVNDIDTVMKNIKNIKKYLEMCLTILDSNISHIKKSQSYINTITKSCNNYKVYSTNTFKIYTLLKKMDKYCKNAKYNNLPLFYVKKPGIRSVKSIRFPLFISDNQNINIILMNKLNCHESYIKIPLMKGTLKCLGLEKYSYPILHTNDIMKHNTNCIPHYSCCIGKKPDRKLYTDSYMIKYWTAKYHINQFYMALEKLYTVKQDITNILHKITQYYNICSTLKQTM